MKEKENASLHSEVILLKDLAPRQAVKGGAGRLVFGQPLEADDEDRRSTPVQASAGQQREAVNRVRSKPKTGRR